MGCYCETTWRTYEFNCSYCWKLDERSKNLISNQIEQFGTDMENALKDARAGSLEYKEFWAQRGKIPGTDLPGFVYAGQYCTTDDWYDFRRLTIYSELDNNPNFSLEDIEDCSSHWCEKQSPWLGYWFIHDTSCNCVGPAPENRYGSLVDNPKKISETIDLTGPGYDKVVRKYLSLKATWEDQYGRACGDPFAVHEDQEPNYPDDYRARWIPRYKLAGKYLDLTYNRYITKYSQEKETIISHSCS